MKRLLLLALLLAAPASAAQERTKPNIIFILADDLGWTDLGCQGSRYYETPHLDRMAAQGLRFTHGYSAGPNCQPSRAALMSGQYGPRTGVYTVGGIDRFDWSARPLRPVDNVTALPLDRTLLPQALKAAGYATALFGKWHLGETGDHHPGRRGFDEALVTMGKHVHFTTNPKVEIPKDAYLADFLTDKAVDFVRRHKDRPFFLYLPHFGVHTPLQAKQELIEKFKGKAAAGGHQDPAYAAMIASVDDSVGRIMSLLDELKLAEHTLLIFSSDNGGVGGYLREGLKKAGDITDNAPLRSGKGSLYEGGIRVPYLFRHPGRIAPGTCDTPISGIDLYPTLLEIAGAARPDAVARDGVSTVPLLKGGTIERDALFWHFPGYLGAGGNGWRTTPVSVIRSGPWKLMEFFEDGRLELYHLKDDVGETRNLAAQEPARVSELHARLKVWRQEVKAPLPTPNPDGRK